MNKERKKEPKDSKEPSKQGESRKETERKEQGPFPSIVFGCLFVLFCFSSIRMVSFQNMTSFCFLSNFPAKFQGNRDYNYKGERSQKQIRDQIEKLDFEFQQNKKLVSIKNKAGYTTNRCHWRGPLALFGVIIQT